MNTTPSPLPPESGLGHLGTPLRARMSGVMSDPEDSYGAYAVQATGFAGLSLLDVVRPGAVFAVGEIPAV